MAVARALIHMTDSFSRSQATDALDQLVDQLLICGGVLSQIIGHMIQTEAAGRFTPDAAPIPESAHAVIRDAIGDAMRRHQDREINAAARIIDKAAHAICETSS